MRYVRLFLNVYAPCAIIALFVVDQRALRQVQADRDEFAAIVRDQQVTISAQLPQLQRELGFLEERARLAEARCQATPPPSRDEPREKPAALRVPGSNTVAR